MVQEKALERVKLDRDSLTTVVRHALRSNTLRVAEWECIPVSSGYTRARLYRISGIGQDQDQSVPWSVILKVVHLGDNRDDPQAEMREVRAYQSGLLEDLPGSIGAPRCYGIIDKGGDEFWIWLEEIVDEIGPVWPPERYAVAARHLGAFNGAYLTGRAAPSYSWLSQDRLLGFMDRYGASMERLKQAPLPPLTRRACPTRVLDGYSRLWVERDRFLKALKRLPQTFCHMDAVRPNLFARGDGSGVAQTVAIDWSYAGIGAVGEDLAPLVSGSMLEKGVTRERRQVISELALQGYIDGLRDAGWEGDPRFAQLGYSIAFPLRYGPMWLGAMFHWDDLDEEQRTRAEEGLGASLEAVADHFAEVGHSLVQLADQARSLIDVFFGSCLVA